MSRHPAWRWLVLLLLLSSGAGRADEQSLSAPPAPVPDAATQQRLRAGEILVQDTREGEAGGSATAQAVFHATPGKIWSVLRDCQANLRFVEGLEECEVLEYTDTHAVTRQVVDKGWMMPRLEYRFETIRHPPDWVIIRLLDGDLKQMEGSWRFEPLADGGGLLVTHEIHVEPRIAAPRWLVRRSLHHDIGHMVACLRYEADASGSEQQRATDHEQCPKGRDG